MGIPPLGKINIVVVVVIHYRQCSRTGENSFVQHMSVEKLKWSNLQAKETSSLAKLIAKTCFSCLNS